MRQLNSIYFLEFFNIYVCQIEHSVLRDASFQNFYTWNVYHKYFTDLHNLNLFQHSFLYFVFYSQITNAFI